MIWSSLLLLLGLLSATPPRLASEVVPDCTDEASRNRCDAAEQARVRALYGVETIEAHRDAGDQVRRVFYVDGYGRDVAAIAFVRRPGHDPEVRVHVPREEGAPPSPPMIAPVPAEAWDLLIERSGLFDRAVMPSPEPADPQEIRICVHAWLYTAEGTDPAQPGDNGGPATIRRRTEDACTDGTTGAFAAEAYRAALPLFPACALLNPAHYRNTASQLAECVVLSGDRMTAARARNAAELLFGLERDEDLPSLVRVTDYRTQVDWNGEHYAGRENDGAARFFLARVVAVERGRFFLAGVEGLDARRARLRGTFARMSVGAEGRMQVAGRAPVEMIWDLTDAGRPLIRSVTVGAFVPGP